MPTHTIAENLQRLVSAKSAIADAIVSKGGSVSAGDGFEAFPSAINALETGGKVKLSQAETPDIIDKIATKTISGEVICDDLIHLPSYIFTDCSLITKAIFQNCVLPSYLGRCFYNCTSLSYVGLPKYASYLAGTFSCCANLENVSIPNCKSIGYQTFYSCSKLKSAIFPECASISSSAFHGCTALSIISFPKCSSIGAYAFRGCKSLTSIQFDSSRVSVGKSAFDNCTSLTSVIFHGSVTFDAYAFEYCSKLSTLICLSYAYFYSSIFYYARNTSIYLLGSSVCGAAGLWRGDKYPYVYVLSELYSQYKSTYPWSTYAYVYSYEGGLDIP